MKPILPSAVRSVVRIKDESGSVCGTGFGYIRPDNYNKKNPGTHPITDGENWRLWYVTCAHVIDAIEVKNGTSSYVSIEMNEESTEAGLKTLQYSVEQCWTRHREWKRRCHRWGPIDQRDYTFKDAAVDVAVVSASTHYIHFDQLDWWAFGPKCHITKSLMQLNGLNEGDDVFIIGFPVGFYKGFKNWPVVRQGVVAQIQPYLQGKAETFLIDGSVFSGNSGGPVVTKRRPFLTDEYSKKNNLIGLTSGYRRTSKKENADLGIVVPLDTINDTIEMALSDPPSAYTLNRPYTYKARKTE